MKPERDLLQLLEPQKDFLKRSTAGVRVIEGVLWGSNVIYYCERCDCLHYTENDFPPHSYRIGLEPCDKDSLGDFALIYKSEIGFTEHEYWLKELN